MDPRVFPRHHVGNQSYSVLRMRPLGKLGSCGTSSLSLPQTGKWRHSLAIIHSFFLDIFEHSYKSSGIQMYLIFRSVYLDINSLYLDTWSLFYIAHSVIFYNKDYGTDNIKG